jgi:hypothetical protein
MTTAPNDQNSTPLQAVVAHHIPGRLRLRFARSKSDEDTLSRVGDLLERIETVKSVQVNPTTGTILVSYETSNDVFINKVQSTGVESGLLTLNSQDQKVEDHPQHRNHQNTGSGPATFAAALIGFVKTINSNIKRASDNQVDLAVLLPLAAGIMALRKFGSKEGTPMWLTLGIFAFQTFLTLHSTAEKHP